MVNVINPVFFLTHIICCCPRSPYVIELNRYFIGTQKIANNMGKHFKYDIIAPIHNVLILSVLVPININ